MDQLVTTPYRRHYRVISVLPPGIQRDDLGLISDLLHDAAVDRDSRLPFDRKLVFRMFRLSEVFAKLASDAEGIEPME
jgi:hypothetical protein